MPKKNKQDQFYGATTIGEKGQVVIPCDARNAMKLEPGDKLLAFGVGEDMLVFTKLSQLEKFEKHLTNTLAHLRK